MPDTKAKTKTKSTARKAVPTDTSPLKTEPVAPASPEPSPGSSTAKPQLHRSKTNRMIAGVAGGLGDYFSVDPTLIRLAFILLVFANGISPILYIILWVILPEAEDQHTLSPSASAPAKKDEAPAGASPSALSALGEDKRPLLGVLLIIVGGLFLLDRFGFSQFLNFDQLWPLLLIFLGLFLIKRR